MFIPLDASPEGLRPSKSHISPNDWDVLARYWYPVAVDGDVQDEPLKGKLLDVDLVIYRVEDKVAVAEDICPHRFIRLSAGTIEQDRLVCPFHGLAFNTAGQCTKVPALGRDARLPANYRLRSIRSVVRYGLVWACLDEQSTEQIPSFPSIEAIGDDHLAYGLIVDWPVSAPRQLENFLDLAHIPFVHEKSAGGDKNAVIKPPRIEQTDKGFRFTAPAHEHPEGGIPRDIIYKHHVRMPFMAEFQVQNADETHDRLHMLNLPVPITAYNCRVFWVFLLPVPSPSRESAPAGNGGDVIGPEDRAVLGHLARHNLPLDHKQEIHLPCDNVAIEFRNHLRLLGLGQGEPEHNQREVA